MSPSLAESSFAVVDLETTGLFPWRHDRVIEIAVIRTDGNGAIQDRYETLVNPGRDIGPSRIHGLVSADVLAAPTFSDIAGDVLRRFDGRVIVAHNARFDLEFLSTEFDRAGFRLPRMAAACTMRLARVLCPEVRCRRLDELCRHFQIGLSQAHAAGADADATAQLLLRLINRGRLAGWQTLTDAGIESPIPLDGQWLAVAGCGRTVPRGDRRAHRPRSGALAELVGRLEPDPDDTEVPIEYLDVLHRALEDRKLEPSEVDALFEIAQRWGLGKGQAESAHRAYFRSIVAMAQADGVLSEMELDDIESLANLIGLAESEVRELLDDASGPQAVVPMPSSESAGSLRGVSVCLTGELRATLDGQQITRDLARRLAAEAGMVPVDGVTKTLGVLVIADPESMSSKAKKARQYGVRIVAESAFWRMLGVPVA